MGFPTPLLEITDIPSLVSTNAPSAARPPATETEIHDIPTDVPTNTPVVRHSAATEIFDTPTVSPTLTSLPALHPNQTVPLINIHMMDESHGWGIEESGHIVHTNDGANTWDDVTPPHGAYTNNGFFALDGLTAWAIPYCLGYNFPDYSYFCDGVNHVVVWNTWDGGNTWLASRPICMTDINYDCGSYAYSEGDGSIIPESIRFIDSQHAWLLISTGTLMQARFDAFYTNDGGKTWELMVSSYDILSSSVTAVEPLDEKRAFLFTNEIYGPWDQVGNDLWYSQSDDGGNNWNEDLFFKLPEAPIESSIWEKLDCGTVNSKAIPPLVLDLTQECLIREQITADNTHYFVHLHSMDGGQTWSYWQQTGDVDFIDGKMGWQLVSKNGASHELQQTRDGGLTWSTIKIVEWDGFLNFINDQVGWALAYQYGVMSVVHTTDGGKTWEIKTQTEPTFYIPCVIRSWGECDEYFKRPGRRAFGSP
jgi:photosystem II stability/assembly factor-like uncharacterized protein